MLNCNLFENINFSCFCFKGSKTKDDDYEKTLNSKLYKITQEYKISILPITQNYDIDNLYPITDHVELWNIFIVGNDKTYILININDQHVIIPNVDQLRNHKASNIMPDELSKILDSIWDATLVGKQLQFYMLWNGKLYFINTYPFYNGKKLVIGAILFMRGFETMPDNNKKKHTNDLKVSDMNLFERNQSIQTPITHEVDKSNRSLPLYNSEIEPKFSQINSVSPRNKSTLSNTNSIFN
jgi:hypothetical protein